MGLVAYADYLPLAETKPEIVAEDGARVEIVPSADAQVRRERARHEGDSERNVLPGGSRLRWLGGGGRDCVGKQRELDGCRLAQRAVAICLLARFADGRCRAYGVPAGLSCSKPTARQWRANRLGAKPISVLLALCRWSGLLRLVGRQALML